jgi:D-sedoheptulose 7-phosphate isomerase
MDGPGGVTATTHRGQAAGAALAEEASMLADAAMAMATRFHRGGKLLAFGTGSAGTDASHVAVEFMHPVIVGKPALPALALDPAGISADRYAHQVRLFGDPVDIAFGLAAEGDDEAVSRGLAQAGKLGLLTVALVGAGHGQLDVEHLLVAHDANPAVVKEVHVTMYHLLWELVHVLLEQPAGLGPRVFG